MGHYFGWVVMDGTLLWVGVGEWGWVVVSGAGFTVWQCPILRHNLCLDNISSQYKKSAIIVMSLGHGNKWPNQNMFWGRFTTRSSRPSVFYKKVFLNISQNLQENNCARVSFLIKLHATLLKKRLCHRCFSVKCVKFLRTNFL